MVVIVEGEDGCRILVDTTGAAELLTGAGVPNANGRIWDWKRRGILRPARVVGRRPVYRMADVWEAEKGGCVYCACLRFCRRETRRGRARIATVRVASAVGTAIVVLGIAVVIVVVLAIAVLNQGYPQP